MAKLSRTSTLHLVSFEERATPAYLASGNLDIVGSNAADSVVVKHVTLSGVAKIQVTHNGSTQYFNASSVPGQIRFWGHGGNDRFDYYGSKCVFADGGAGNDFISADQGADLLMGGSGDDTVEGWGGNDELQGGDDADILDGGAGNDRLFGQAGNDILGGGAGNDAIIGGTGMDISFGGSGVDQFWECNDVAFFITPMSTRFGLASSGGVQDASYNLGDRIWS